MSDRKRCSASFLRDSTIAATATATACAELPSQQGGLPPAIRSPQPSKKKRRVSFCNTTKPPSDRKALRPLNAIIMKHSASCTALPQLSDAENLIGQSESSGTEEIDLTVSPAAFVQTIILQSKSLTGPLRGEDIISSASKSVTQDSYYLSYSEDHLQAYTTDKVNAVQCNDVPALRSLLDAGHLMQASNRFGESLLHTSCRRGFADVVDFFVGEARVCPRVRDDMGRTPMHDACWSSSPPNHDIMKMLICAAPELLLSKDKRGHSPFDYARREYWPNWVAFLNEHRQFIVNSLVSSYLDGQEELANEGKGVSEENRVAYQ